MKRILFGIAALLFASAVWSQPSGMGPGMMGGDKRGSGGGPAMMGGYGPGGGCGPGYGMGPEMMGGYGMGPGMMWGNGGCSLGCGIADLTNEQRAKLTAIQDEYRDKQWKLMESMHGLMRNQHGFYGDGKFDEKAAREAYDSMNAIRKQMFENSLDAHKRLDGVLTAKQREQLRSSGQ